MTLEEAAKHGNEAAVDMFKRLLDQCDGPGLDYECAIGSVATVTLFHAYRIALLRTRSHGKAVETLQALLSDVALSIGEYGTDSVSFTVES